MNNRQSGMSLLEILAAIAVGTVLFIGLTDMIDISMEDARGQQAAHHQSQIADASRNYIAANYAALMNDTAGGNVVSIDFAALKSDFLPAGFHDQNSYQQRTCVLVLQDGGKLNALVVGYGGLAIPDRSIAATALNAGQGAGYINSIDTGTARGSSWSLDTTPYRSGSCQGGVSPLTGSASDAGHLVTNIFYDGPGQLSTDFLYRDPVPGRTDLNQMNTPLLMANAALVNVGDPCSHTALAIESTSKNVVVCDNGTWRYSSSSWKPPVASYAALPAAPSAQDGDVHVTRDTGRAFVYNGTSNTWDALAIDRFGNLTVPGQVTTNALNASGNINVGGSATVHGLLDARDNARITRTLDVGQTLTARGNIDAWGNMDIDGYILAERNIESRMFMRAYTMATTTGIVLDGISTAGATCNRIIGNVLQNPLGTVMRDANGMLLNCTNANMFVYANGRITP